MLRRGQSDACAWGGCGSPTSIMTSVLPDDLGNAALAKPRPAAVAAMGVAALGIVFGDIGTSPLYTLKTAFDYLHGDATPERVLGILSLVIWTLFLITSIKYVTVAMSIDNDGEGGILALMSLLRHQAAAASADRRARPSRRRADLWRRRDHAGDFRAVGARRPRYRRACGTPLRGAGRRRHPAGAVRGPAARDLAHRRRLRADHAVVVRDHRRARLVGHRPAPCRAAGDQSVLRRTPHRHQRLRGLPGAGRNLPLRHRRRSALRRYGPFRQRPDPHRLVVDRISLPGAQLCAASARSRCAAS